MIDLGKYRIIQLDRYNLTFEEFKDLENTKTKEKYKKWIRAGGYYGNLQQCIKGLKEYIVANNLLNNESNTPNEIIDYLDRLNDSYVNCDLRIKEVDTNEV